MRVAFLLALGAIGLMAVPAANAATYGVQLGETSRQGLPPTAGVYLYMPAVVSVHAGDSVEFTGGVGTPHTVTFLNGDDYDEHFLVQPAGDVYANVIDADGVTPFWFNGQPRFQFDLAAFGPAGAKNVTGRRYQSSGIIAGPKSSATYRFNRVGSYEYRCLLHPGMLGKVNVKPRRARVAGRAAVARLAKKQETQAKALARALNARKAPANTVLNGPAVRSRAGDVNLFELKPAKLTVPVGTTVNFRADTSTEQHNIGFGPKEYLDALIKANNLFPNKPGDPNNVPGYDLYGSEDPATLVNGVYTFDGTGFLAAPVTDASAATPFARSQRVTFTAPGTYVGYCLLHYPDMKTTITVTP